MIVRITRVKVGNRQAPQQHQKPHPTKVGFLRLRFTRPETGDARATLQTRALVSLQAAVGQLRYVTSPPTNGQINHAFPTRTPYNLYLREEFLRQLHPISRSDG